MVKLKIEIPKIHIVSFLMILATVSHWSCRDSIIETNLTWEVRERVTVSAWCWVLSCGRQRGSRGSVRRGMEFYSLE